MEVQTVDHLVQITLGLGTLVTTILMWVAVIAWRISRGLAKRDARIEQIAQGLADHEHECTDFRQKVDERFTAGTEHFSRIERSLGRIEGKMGIQIQEEEKP